MTRLVLLPGLDGSGVLFRPLLAYIPSALTPIVCSYPPTKRLGYPELIELVLQQLPADEPFVLLGESFSGPIAIQIAARRPAGLRGVVLCGTFVQCPLGPIWSWLRYLVFRGMFLGFTRFAQAKALLGGYATDELRRLQREALSQVLPSVLAYRVRQVLQVDVRDEFKSCPVPILDLRGNRDEVVWQRNARAIRSLRSDCRRANFDTPHLILQTKPMECAQEIDWFVRVICNEQNVPSSSSRGAKPRSGD